MLSIFMLCVPFCQIFLGKQIITLSTFLVEEKRVGG